MAEKIQMINVSRTGETIYFQNGESAVVDENGMVAVSEAGQNYVALLKLGFQDTGVRVTDE